MKYFGMPLGMRLLFQKSFQKNMIAVLGFDKKAAAEITARARRKYKEIIAMLPEFERNDPVQE